MAELGRAQPVVVAAIGVLLTANMSVLATKNAEAERRVAAVARTTTSAVALPQGRIYFGKADTLLGPPTVFSVRADGTDLEASDYPPKRAMQPQSAWSHDHTRRAVADEDLWILRRDGGDPRRLTNNTTATPVRQPVWSPDDRYVAFVWGSTVVVMDTAGQRAGVAYRPPKSVTAREFVWLYDWTDEAT